MSFAPNLSALPAAQRALWTELKQVPRAFVLYGGTGLALRLGHRQSEDFDFFADAPVNPDELLHRLSLLKGATIRQKGLNTLAVTLKGPAPIRISFFGLTLRRVGDPEATDDNVLQVATLRDIAGCKMATIQSRAEAKDYFDIHALLQHGIEISEMLGAAQAIYGEQFSPMISLKALTWFGDGDLPSLPEDLKMLLRSKASEVRQVTNIQPLAGGISPAADD